MLEIIVLIFLTRSIGNLAVRKGLAPGPWKLYTVLAWVTAEILGFFIAASVFTNILGILGTAIFSAFGGYLIVRKTLENKPDTFNDDIEKIGSDDLQPPRKDN